MQSCFPSQDWNLEWTLYREMELMNLPAAASHTEVSGLFVSFPVRSVDSSQELDITLYLVFAWACRQNRVQCLTMAKTDGARLIDPRIF